MLGRARPDLCDRPPRRARSPGVWRLNHGSMIPKSMSSTRSGMVPVFGKDHAQIKKPTPPGDTERRECRREQQAIARWLPAAPVSATIAAHNAITTTITAPCLCRGCARRERDRGQADNARNLRSDRTHRICENNRENREPANQERAKTRRQGHVADPFNCIAITRLVSTPAACTRNARATRTLRQPLTHPALLGSIRTSAKGSDA